MITNGFSFFRWRRWRQEPLPSFRFGGPEWIRFAKKRGWANNESYTGICPCLVSSFIKIDHQCGGLPSYDRFKRRVVQIDLHWIGEQAVLFHGGAFDDANSGQFANVIA
jgi:hypothetical protein